MWFPFLCAVKRPAGLVSLGPQPFQGLPAGDTPQGARGMGALLGGPHCVGLQDPVRPNSTAEEAFAPLPGTIEVLVLRRLLWQLWGIWNLETSVHCLTRSLPTVFAPQVAQAVRWLVSRCPRALDLCSQTLIQYVEDGVSREFSSRFFHDRSERRRGGLASQEPSAVIELFNSVLHFLASVVSSEQLCDLSWPVTEFAEAGGSRLLPHLHWNAPEHLAWLKQAILGFQLPQMDLPPPEGACPSRESLAVGWQSCPALGHCRDTLAGVGPAER